MCLSLCTARGLVVCAFSVGWGDLFAVAHAEHTMLVVASARCLGMVVIQPSLAISKIAVVGAWFILKCHSLASFCRVVDLCFGWGTGLCKVLMWIGCFLRSTTCGIRGVTVVADAVLSRVIILFVLLYGFGRML